MYTDKLFRSRSLPGPAMIQIFFCVAMIQQIKDHLEVKPYKDKKKICSVSMSSPAGLTHTKHHRWNWLKNNQG
jgi:hypothetical protein